MIGPEQLLRGEIAAELKALSHFDLNVSLPEELLSHLLRERPKRSALGKAS